MKKVRHDDDDDIDVDGDDDDRRIVMMKVRL